MTVIQPRNPVVGVVRLIALAWTLLSLLGVACGVVALVYAASWGCFGHHLGWFGCTLATAMLPFAAFASLFVAGIVLFFAHVFYIAGARGERMEFRKRRRARGFLGDVLMDILD